MTTVNEQLPVQAYYQDGFVISTDPARFDVELIHHFLADEAYWSHGVARETVVAAMQHSLCFGVYVDAEGSDQQVGFARVITDFTTFAYVADVFILPAYQGRGLGKWLVRSLLAHPNLQGLRRWMLHTRDAHSLYRQFRFKNDPNPDNCLILRPNDPNW